MLTAAIVTVTVTLLFGGIVLAAHRKRRRNRSFQVWPIDQTTTLAALASETVIKTVIINLAQEAWLHSADLTWTVRGATGGEGPVMFGLADDNLTVAEIAEAIGAAPTSQSDRIQLERASRPVRVVGNFPFAAADEVHADGRKVRTKIKWMQAAAIDPCMWVQNKSGATLTTGAIVRVTGNLYGTWK